MQFRTVVSIVKGFKEHICPNDTLLVTSSSIASSKVIGTRIAGSSSEEFSITKLTPRNNEAVDVNESALKSLVHRVVWESRKSRQSVRATILQAAISEMLTDYNVHVITYRELETRHSPLFSHHWLPNFSRNKKHSNQKPPTPPPRSPELPPPIASQVEQREAASAVNVLRQSSDNLASRCSTAAQVQNHAANNPTHTQTHTLEVNGILYTSDTAKGHTLFNEPEFGDSVLILLT